MTKDEAIQFLKTVYKVGDTVQTDLKHVSRSGMTRHIAILAPLDNKVVNISYKVAIALDYRMNKSRDALVVGGCGMDMGFHVAYSLSGVLYENSFYCIGEKCPANDHFNGDRNYKKHKHSDGGYALRHSWV